MTDNEQMLALAEEIEQSTGLLRMVPGQGTPSLGIRKTALVAKALRAAAQSSVVREALASGRAITVIIPEGYDSAWDFLNDCGLEAIPALSPDTPREGEK